jgi:GAF domain-containing protein
MDRSAVYGGGPVDLSPGGVAEAVRTAVAMPKPQDALQAVIEMAIECGPCDAASITMLGPGRALETVAFSDERILHSDQLQYSLNEGPCVDAVWTNGIYLVPDIPAAQRWPRWTAAATAEDGIGAVLSVHLFTDNTLGSLNLYSTAPRTFDDTAIEDARVIAAHASVVVAHTRAQENLWRAIDIRLLIGQAQGMLMQKHGLTPAQAFAVLRRYSQHHNTKITAVAALLTSTGQLPDLDPTVHPGTPPQGLDLPSTPAAPAPRPDIAQVAGHPPDREPAT